MDFKIDTISPEEYPTVVDLWEASVRATHDFLREEDILFFKPLILNEYLGAVELNCARDHSHNMVGFLGVADKKIEMLFIHPDVRGKGIGKQLVHYAISQLRADKVDVNEQNSQTVAFYKHLGFQVISRSALDGLGKPYPILSMELKK
jgi:putative acetyltransferase